MAGTTHADTGIGSAPVSSLDFVRERRLRRARDRRLVRNLSMVHRLVHSYALRIGHREELVGVAEVGLVRALSEFDPAEGQEFAEFAEPRVVAELERYAHADRLRLEGMGHTLARYADIADAKREIADAISRQDHVRDLAGFLACDVGTLVEGLMD